MDKDSVNIMQQEASVELLRNLVKLRRAPAQALEDAERRLAELREITPGKVEEVRQLPKKETSTPVPADPLLSAELMRKIDSCQRRLAEVCNSMHSIPKDVPCPEIMTHALSIKQEHEDLWTQYRFLERNGRLPQDPGKEEKLSADRSLELLQAVDIKKKLGEKRSKLRRKIADPANLRNKLMAQWKDDLAQAELDYQHYDELVKILKSQ